MLARPRSIITQRWHLAAPLALALLALSATPAHSQNASPATCGELRTPGAYGPFDYRKAAKQQLEIVESHHFDAGVESLTRGMTGPYGGDIAYTLRAFPNHHRALAAMQRLAEKEKRDPPLDAKLPVECYFERALRFQPEDTVARMLYASFLVSKKRNDEAVRQLESTRAIAGDNGFTHYNIGLIYFDMKDYEHALAQAHRAVELGFTRTDLKDKLVAVGKWAEPRSEAEPAASAASAAP